MKKTSSLIATALVALTVGTAWGDGGAIVAPIEGHPNYGYTVTGLGDFGNETALVFTNPAVTATWTVPGNLANVQFLVVGGGGGGGGDNINYDGCIGGAGGGGGGVVTGIVNSIAQDAMVAITVGAGGAGGTAGKTPGTAYSPNNYGGAKPGAASLFKINNVTYVTANGGGRDQGVDGRYSTSKGTAGGDGGSSAGSRPKITTRGKATKGTIGSTATSLLTATLFGNQGGAGKSDVSYAAGGGGGATEAGGSPSDYKAGGKGGEGLASDITGTSAVYGSGGGGGTAASGGTVSSGGTGAGNGGRGGINGTAAVANQGGGGGGGGGQKNGGNGGSGIVVFRYSFDPYAVDVPSIASKEYTGETLTADIETTAAYTVVENNGGSDVGTYDVVVSLNADYHWMDEQLANTITLKFEITQAANTWTTEPSITKASWTHGLEDAGVLTNGVTRFGAVAATIAKDGGEATSFDGTLPTAAGSYVVTYTAPAATANYTAPETTSYTLSFTIYAAEAIPDYALSLGTLSVGTDRVLSVPWTLACDVTTEKTADVFVRYALDGATTTNTAKIATGQALSSSGTGSIADLKPGATYWVEVYTVVDETAAEPTALQSVAVPGTATDFSASATFTPIPMEFIVKGSVTPGLGTTTVTVKWSLNNANAYDETETFTFALGDDGTFSKKIPHSELSDTLTWEVSAENTVTTTTWGEQTFDSVAAVSGTTVCRDTGRTTYTWTGLGGDNLWTNVLNWSGTNTTKDSLECYGYPGLKFGWYLDTIVFTNDAVVDLRGGAYGVRDLDNGETANIRFSPNIKVTLRNGEIDLNGAPYLLGANGATLTFDNCKTTLYGTEGHFVDFAAGSTTIFSGTITSLMRYRPTKANTKVIFRDGTISTLYSTDSSIKNTTTVDITNAVWHIERHPKETADTYNPRNGLGHVVTFRDGPDRQARLTTVSYLYIDLRNTYDIVIPAGGLADATIEAGYISSDTTVGTFKVDVSQYAKKARVPLVKFTNAGNAANNNTRVTAQLGNGSLAVQAIDRGKDVTEKRKARLVWDNATQTIYYEQDYTAGTILILQ